MTYLISSVPDHSSIKNIIFDFGGVICNLDIQRTVDKFKEFGLPKKEITSTQKEQDQQFDLLVSSYETGLISSPQFRDAIRNNYQVAPTDRAIDDAWNALLAGIPEPRIRLLENVRKNYRIFLLSNSNEIHYLKYREELQTQFGYTDFDDLFEKAYFSYSVHLRKPDPAIFKLVLTENNLTPAETLFIDDTLIHIESARGLNIKGYHLGEGEEICSLFH
jgi:glucose-1-phosphatase